MTLETALSRRNMRIFNLASIGLITIAWMVRFYYFGKQEVIVEQTVVITTTTPASTAI